MYCCFVFFGFLIFKSQTHEFLCQINKTHCIKTVIILGNFMGGVFDSKIKMLNLNMLKYSEKNNNILLIIFI